MNAGQKGSLTKKPVGIIHINERGKNMTLHEKAKRYDIMNCITGESKCEHCGKTFNFKLGDFYCLNMFRGLVYKCHHCGGQMYMKDVTFEKLGGAE